MKRVFRKKGRVPSSLDQIVKDMEERLGRKLNDEEMYNVIKTLNHMALYYNAGEVM